MIGVAVRRDGAASIGAPRLTKGGVRALTAGLRNPGVFASVLAAGRKPLTLPCDLIPLKVRLTGRFSLEKPDANCASGRDVGGHMLDGNSLYGPAY